MIEKKSVGHCGQLFDCGPHQGTARLQPPRRFVFVAAASGPFDKTSDTSNCNVENNSISLNKFKVEAFLGIYVFLNIMQNMFQEPKRGGVTGIKSLMSVG